MNRQPRRPLATLVAVILVAAFSLTGCGTPDSASSVTVEVLPTESAAELLRLSGTGAPYTSVPLRLADQVTLRVHWDQSSTGEFSFGLASAASAGSGGDPAASELTTFELALGPSAGASDAPFLPGNYVVQVTSADGPWLIWIETVPDE